MRKFFDCGWQVRIGVKCQSAWQVSRGIKTRLGDHLAKHLFYRKTEKNRKSTGNRRKMGAVLPISLGLVFGMGESVARPDAVMARKIATRYFGRLAVPARPLWEKIGWWGGRGGERKLRAENCLPKGE